MFQLKKLKRMKNGKRNWTQRRQKQAYGSMLEKVIHAI